MCISAHQLNKNMNVDRLVSSGMGVIDVDHQYISTWLSMLDGGRDRTWGDSDCRGDFGLF